MGDVRIRARGDVGLWNFAGKRERFVGVEVDDDLAPVLIAGIFAEAGLRNFAGGEFGVGSKRPMERVGEAEFLAGARFFFGVPERDNVICAFEIGGKFDEMNFAGAPVATWFDPDAGDLVVEIKDVLIAREVAIALEKAEAADVCVGENLMLERSGVVQRAPGEFVLFSANEEAVGVVNFGAIIVGFCFRVFAEPKHAGERRDAEGFNVRAFAHEDDSRDVGKSGFAGAHQKFIGACATRAFEETETVKGVVAFFGFGEPPFCENWKFLLAIGFAGVESEAARGGAVALAFAEHSEIAGAEKTGDFIPAIGIVEAIEEFEAGVTRVGGNAFIDFEISVVEEILHEANGLNVRGVELIYLNRNLVEIAGMKKFEMEG